MKKFLAISPALVIALMLFSCAPVLNREIMKEGVRNPSLDELRANPDAYKGKLFILGGLVVETRFLADGSQIEVLYVPVDSYGNLEDSKRGGGRFLAVFPKSRGLLDPVVFKKGREVTLAGEFAGIKQGKIDEMEYTYPLFEIRQVHLFEEERYYSPYPYPYYYSYPYPHPYWSYPGPWPPPPGWW